MVDANTTVTRSLAWLFWEPVMFIMFCQQLLQALAEGLQLSLAREPLGAEELGDEGHGGSNLAYHGGSPSVKGMHGGGGWGRPGAAGARRRGPDGGAATPGFLTGRKAERKRRREERTAFFFFI